MSFMSDRIFVDTNILVYAHDLSAGDRHAKASAALRLQAQKIMSGFLLPQE
jgi:predicted nucleic acid-binding protein